MTEATRELAKLARRHARKAIDELARLGLKADSESVRVSANIALIDRAYGKPSLALEHTGKDGGAVQVLIAGDDAKLL